MDVDDGLFGDGAIVATGDQARRLVVDRRADERQVRLGERLGQGREERERVEGRVKDALVQERELGTRKVVEVGLGHAQLSLEAHDLDDLSHRSRQWRGESVARAQRQRRWLTFLAFLWRRMSE